MFQPYSRNPAARGELSCKGTAVAATSPETQQVQPGAARIFDHGMAGMVTWAKHGSSAMLSTVGQPWHLYWLAFQPAKDSTHGVDWFPALRIVWSLSYLFYAKYYAHNNLGKVLTLLRSRASFECMTCGGGVYLLVAWHDVASIIWMKPGQMVGTLAAMPTPHAGSAQL